MKINRKGLKVISAAEAVVILILIIIIGFMAVRNRSVPASAKPQTRVRPVIEKEETFYQMDGRKILLHNSTMGETFIPVYADVPASAVTVNDLKKDADGFIRYNGSGGLSSFVGIDISEHQGDIDWQQVKEAGVDFAFVRVGYRSYGGGLITIDSNLHTNLEGASAAGIDVGVYFYSQAVNTDEAIEEADAVLDAIEGYDITYPVAFDWELVYNDQARTDSVSVETLADCCVAFCERVKSAGYTPMIYQNTSTAMNKLDLPRVRDYEFWLAEFSSFPSFYYEYDIWQYSSEGTVPGIDAAVDLNICFRDYAEKNPAIPGDNAEATTE
ncbi:MAG: glycoside hydrolase family 25 protein [Alistipes sp.]|nr:glycoside hydrolase family 25 protein [Alistipes sp.]